MPDKLSLSVFQGIPESVLIFDENERLVFCNDECDKGRNEKSASCVSGVTFQQMIRANFNDGMFANPGDKSADDFVADRLWRFRNPSTPFEEPMADGTWLKISERTIDGRYTLSIQSDVTELKNRQLTLQESEARAVEAKRLLENAMAFTPEGLAIWNAESRLMFCNDAYRGFYRGAEDKIVTGVAYRDLAALAAELELAEEISGSKEDWVEKMIDAHFNTRKGDHAKLRDGRHLLINESKTPEGWTVSVYTDITEQIKMEGLANEQRDRIIAIVNNVMDGIITTDEKGVIETLNSAAERIFGYTDEEMAGRNISEFLPHPHSQKHGQYLKDFLNNGRGGVIGKNREFEGLRKDGSKFPLELNVSEMKLGEKRMFIGVVRDITLRVNEGLERAAMEYQLHQAQKMEALGQMSAGMAHEFNNMLMPMIGLTEMAIDDLPENSEIRENLGTVLAAGHRASKLIKNILSFSYADQLSTELIMLTTVMEDALVLLRAGLPSTIDFETNIPKEEICAAFDPSEIHQIVMNLGGNARDAIGETRGGRINISLEPVSLSQADAEENNLAAGDYALIEVADNGKGMDRTTRERVFDPFFTTKEVGSGTGMGLSVVHGIIKTCGGSIKVTSALGEGTTIRLFLPVSTLPSGNPAPSNQ